MSEVIAFKQSTTSNSGGDLKDLYEVGEIPPLGHVPEKMYAWAIRKERHGPPDEAMQAEVLPTWKLDSHDVLIFHDRWTQEPLPYRGIGRLRHCLGGGFEG